MKNIIIHVQFIFVLSCITLCSAFPGEVATCGNGSSGVGTGIFIHEGLCAALKSGAVTIEAVGERSRILDGKTGEKLLLLSPIRRSNLGKYGQQLVPAKLGEIQGLEYIPASDGKSEIAYNFWVICGAKTLKCLLIEPLSFTNSKVDQVMGALHLVDVMIDTPK